MAPDSMQNLGFKEQEQQQQQQQQQQSNESTKR